MKTPRGAKDRIVDSSSGASTVSGLISAATVTPGVPSCSAEKPLTMEMPKSGNLKRWVEGASGKQNPYGIDPVMNVIEPFSGTSTKLHSLRICDRKLSTIIDCGTSQF